MLSVLFRFYLLLYILWYIVEWPQKTGRSDPELRVGSGRRQWRTGEVLVSLSICAICKAETDIQLVNSGGFTVLELLNRTDWRGRWDISLQPSWAASVRFSYHNIHATCTWVWNEYKLGLWLVSGTGCRNRNGEKCRNSMQRLAGWVNVENIASWFVFTPAEFVEHWVSTGLMHYVVHSSHLAHYGTDKTVNSVRSRKQCNPLLESLYEYI